jgi:hypothetical protein
MLLGRESALRESHPSVSPLIVAALCNTSLLENKRQLSSRSISEAAIISVGESSVEYESPLHRRRPNTDAFIGISVVFLTEAALDFSGILSPLGQNGAPEAFPPPLRAESPAAAARRIALAAALGVAPSSDVLDIKCLALHGRASPLLRLIFNLDALLCTHGLGLPVSLMKLHDLPDAANASSIYVFFISSEEGARRFLSAVKARSGCWPGEHIVLVVPPRIFSDSWPKDARLNDFLSIVTGTKNGVSDDSPDAGIAPAIVRCVGLKVAAVVLKSAAQ